MMGFTLQVWDAPHRSRPVILPAQAGARAKSYATAATAPRVLLS